MSCYLKRSKVFLFILFITSSAFANSPGTPSSSYNNDYYFSDKSKNNINENLTNQIPIQIQNQNIIR